VKNAFTTSLNRGKNVNLKIIFLTTVIVLASCQSPPTKTDANNGGAEHGFLPPPVWNATMQNLKQDIIGLQHYIFDKKQFENPDNHEYLEKQIHKLAIESKNVKHDPTIFTKDPTIRFVAAQFADELQKADENFKAGWSEYSRWQLVRSTSYCLECHTRMRDGISFNPETTSRSYLTTLPASAQVEFLISFRQFDPAFNFVLEKLKDTQSSSSINTESDRLARLGLLIAVQYMQDPEKAKMLTRAIDQNQTLPLYLKKSNQLWKKSLSAWNPNEYLKVIPQVRNLVQSRISEIEDMRAIPALLRILTEGLSRDELGEALFLTGQSYESLNKISILSLHENYYEACVRQAPHTKWGPVCYKKLSDTISSGYTGSGGTRIPRDVKNRLNELKKVIESQK
jgi:hypothetical protein